LQTLALVFALSCLSLPAFAQQGELRGEGLSQTIDCGGDDARLEGNGNRVTFRGPCRGLYLRGEGNRVEVELAPGAQIHIEGNGNRVRYHNAGGQTPEISIRGEQDQVTAGAPGRPFPAASAAGPEPLYLTGNGQNRDVDCAGRDVRMEGSGGAITLRGGCRSLSVHGNGVEVHADLAPEARVAVQGNGDLVTYRLTGPGSAPDISVSGRGSDVRPGS